MHGEGGRTIGVNSEASIAFYSHTTVLILTINLKMDALVAIGHVRRSNHSSITKTSHSI